MQTVTLARHAMATRFELVLHRDDPIALRAAGEEALDEVARLENQLSLFPELTVLRLCDESLSVSAIWERHFQSGEQNFGHVVDPRTGQPVGGSWLSAVVLPSAIETDHCPRLCSRWARWGS
jgi:thiamine biosynthesis lipoprotein ApbE